MKKLSLFLVVLVYGCASVPDVVVPELPYRTLMIHPEKAALYYQWRVCTKSFLGACRKWEDHQDIYDLSDPAMRKQLRDMGFKAKVLKDILP